MPLRKFPKADRVRVDLSIHNKPGWTRKMPWKIIIQCNFKRTKHEPLTLCNLQYAPREKYDQIENPEFKGVADSMFQEYLSIVQSGHPTAPGRKTSKWISKAGMREGRPHFAEPE